MKQFIGLCILATPYFVLAFAANDAYVGIGIGALATTAVILATSK